MRRFQDTLQRYKKGRLTAEEVGELLGLSARHLSRQCLRYALKRRACLGTSNGSKLPSRSRGVPIRIGQSPVRTVLLVKPLRWLPD